MDWSSRTQCRKERKELDKGRELWLIEYPYIGEIFLCAGHVADGVDAGSLAGRPLTDNWLNTFYNANTTRSR